ncbi:exodeoxyribonuclease III [Legionella hackeliae]|uniref:Endonuclease/exonuclease/phosphatase n=1 Tax=Legionella hackeliae TaxID=449 RepID=A0A0A8USF0_LEGHA|nr:exodeoxyribonuclease III [Legionella hackeliae]KTD09898.1 hypothetical protein Lhac_2266 [Legionella hackeliae]CEK11800.1 Endonuclease/exonuclease/phosphatase [Legionella hackeliae]STX48570.1 exodeoxyribonuclease III [Legionella hackeliae]
MPKIASWNVNSIKIRLEQILNWLQSTEIDILGVQETKLIDEHFPTNIFKELGYHVAFTGQKSYNGVALISRHPISEVIKELPDFEDPQRRLLAATIGDIRLINLYVPNGSEIPSEKYTYKLAWLQKTIAFIKQQLMLYPKLIVLGDFNIAPEDKDVHDPLEWQNSVMVSPAERQAFADLLALGLIDSFRKFAPEDKEFTWWDYRAASFRRNRGLRIDHILLSSDLKEVCKGCSIDKVPRKWERPSDHAPVWIEISG